MGLCLGTNINTRRSLWEGRDIVVHWNAKYFETPDLFEVVLDAGPPATVFSSGCMENENRHSGFSSLACKALSIVLEHWRVSHFSEKFGELQVRRSELETKLILIASKPFIQKTPSTPHSYSLNENGLIRHRHSHHTQHSISRSSR